MLTHATARMKLEGIMLSDIVSHMHKKVHYDSIYMRYFSSVQSLSRVQLFATPWTAARQASLSIINSCSSFKLISIESVVPSNHLILCRPLLLWPSFFPSIRFFSNESVLHIRWPKYWRFSFNISPSSEVLRVVKFRETESRMVVAKCWEEERS